MVLDRLILIKRQVGLTRSDTALVHQSIITGIPKPNPRDLAFLQEWMKRPSMGNVYLLGQDSDVWANPEESDLIALQARDCDNTVSRWMSDILVHWYHQTIGKRLRVSYALTATSLTVLKAGTETEAFGLGSEHCRIF